MRIKWDPISLNLCYITFSDARILSMKTSEHTKTFKKKPWWIDEWCSVLCWGLQWHRWRDLRQRVCPFHHRQTLRRHWSNVGCPHHVLTISRVENVPYLLSLSPHQGLVLTNLELLAINDAGAFRAGLVFVVGVFLQVGFAEASLLLVVRLLLCVRHRLPFRTWTNDRKWGNKNLKYLPFLWIHDQLLFYKSQ